ncbi:hypothetical protein [Rathayibacter oskolensis]|uniref:hypothetical protein n=1 Tax=Rathayibacter oskolensis TaxID=1891671 RepID=UPI000A1CDE7E|nr:hypothetical protein [Rathayibacter oskolensis]
MRSGDAADAALSLARSPASTTFAAAPTDEPVDHERRRQVLRPLVGRAVAGPSAAADSAGTER